MPDTLNETEPSGDSAREDPSTEEGEISSLSLDGRLKDIETSLIARALAATGGNKTKAAELLRIKRSTLNDRIKRCGIGRTIPAAWYESTSFRSGSEIESRRPVSLSGQHANGGMALVDDPGEVRASSRLAVQVAASILAADFLALGPAVAASERGGADFIHVDIMDGHFVPNITMGPSLVRSLKHATTVPLDVHLMLADPDRYLEAFAEAGAGRLAVHVEASPHLNRTVHAIKSLGVRAGVVLNPSTPVVALDEIAADIDFVLVMSVNPGFANQTFIPRATAKIAAVRALLDRVGNTTAPIAVEGGIDLQTAPEVVGAGARTLVVGSAIFHEDDPEHATRVLKAAATAALFPQ